MHGEGTVFERTQNIFLEIIWGLIQILIYVCE
jgi:hypothetical protein